MSLYVMREGLNIQPILVLFLFKEQFILSTVLIQVHFNYIFCLK